MPAILHGGRDPQAAAIRIVDAQRHTGRMGVCVTTEQQRAIPLGFSERRIPSVAASSGKALACFSCMGTGTSHLSVGRSRPDGESHLFAARDRREGIPGQGGRFCVYLAGITGAQ